MKGLAWAFGLAFLPSFSNGIETVSSLEINKYVGRWYQVRESVVVMIVGGRSAV